MLTDAFFWALGISGILLTGGLFAWSVDEVAYAEGWRRWKFLAFMLPFLALTGTVYAFLRALG